MSNMSWYNRPKILHTDRGMWSQWGKKERIENVKTILNTVFKFVVHNLYSGKVGVRDGGEGANTLRTLFRITEHV